MSSVRSQILCNLTMASLILCMGLSNLACAQSDDVASRLRVPEGFEIEVFASGLKGARFMTHGPDSAVYLSLPRQGEIVALHDRDRRGEAERVEVIATDLNRPHGMVFHQGSLWVAETDGVVKYESYRGGRVGKKTQVVSGLPGGGNHWTRTIGFGPEDGLLYVSIGSSCNICEEDDPRRASIVRYQVDGSKEEIFAKGLRNAVGFEWHPDTKELWATHNGRDWLGDDLPPEEIVNIVVQGGDYGWPYCYGDRVPSPDKGFHKPERCPDTIAPAITDTAHSAPLGCAFYTGDQFPEEYRGDFFVAYHGSWNRSTSTGYKVVRVRVEDGRPVSIDPFLTGFLPDGESNIGRPVDVLVDLDGSLLVSDDAQGRVFRIRYVGG